MLKHKYNLLIGLVLVLISFFDSFQKGWQNALDGLNSQRSGGNPLLDSFVLGGIIFLGLELMRLIRVKIFKRNV